MINQEEIYQLIFGKEWSKILSLLHSHRQDIESDDMLQKAASIFEQEFFNSVHEYPINEKDIVDNLETLYILNYGNFYKLLPSSYKTLIVELVKRKPFEDAIPFARTLPDEDSCKEVIAKYEAQKEKEMKLIPPQKITMNWIELYNRLFALINVQGDAATYFSGPRFIDTVREFEPYFPNYTQYIELRNNEGKSTSRKIFYYDILMGLNDNIRINVINRMLDILRQHKPEEVEQIEILLGIKQKKEHASSVEAQSSSSGNLKVFISYSWDSEEHKEWVLKLADRLCLNGIDVILDRYYLKPGKNLPHFVEDSISKAQRIIIIYTPNYKLKADKRTGGVGYEYSIMNAELYNNQTSNEKIIPVLRAGNMDESIPAFMQQFIHIDACNDENFENSYNDLVREIYNEPEIQKPIIGEKPTFEKRRVEITVENPKAN